MSRDHARLERARRDLGRAWPASRASAARFGPDSGQPDPAPRGGPGPRGPGNGTRGPGNKKLAEVARGSTLNLVGAVVASAATFAITVLVTHMSSPSVAGAFFSATSLFLIVESVASLGAYTGAVYFIARLRLLGEEGRINAILRAAVIPVVVVSVTGAVTLLLFAGPLARVLLGGHLGQGGASPGAVATALRALAITLPFAAVLDTLLGASRGYRDMRPTVVINQLTRSVAQLIGVAVAVAAGSVALLAPLWALPYIPAAAAAWLWLRWIRRHQTSRLSSRAVPPELAALLALATPVRPDGTKMRPGETHTDERLANANPRGFWRFTTPRAIASLAQITIQRIDIVLVAIIRGPAEAAVYTAATRFLVVGQLGNGAISMAAQPQFTELFAIGANRRANVVYQATTGWLILLTWPMYLLVVVYGPEFLAIFGHAYQAGYDVLVILGITQLVAAACGQVDMVLITTGRSSWSLINGLLAVVVNVGLDLVLIPRYGITGAAIGWAAAIGVANVMPLIQIARSVRLHPFGRGTFVACALCLACFGAVPLALRYILGGGPGGIAAAMVAGSAMLAGGLWRFRGVLHLSVMPGLSALARKVRPG
jgi:O-antigen/teichoic acid export membrane protein